MKKQLFLLLIFVVVSAQASEHQTLAERQQQRSAQARAHEGGYYLPLQEATRRLREQAAAEAQAARIVKKTT